MYAHNCERHAHRDLATARRPMLMSSLLVCAFLLYPAASRSDDRDRLIPVKSSSDDSGTDSNSRSFIEMARKLPGVGKIVDGFEHMATTARDQIDGFHGEGPSPSVEELDNQTNESVGNMVREYVKAGVESLETKYPKVAKTAGAIADAFGLAEDPVGFTLGKVDEKLKDVTGVSEIEEYTGLETPDAVGSDGVVKAVKGTLGRYGEKLADLGVDAQEVWKGQVESTSGSEPPAEPTIDVDKGLWESTEEQHPDPASFTGHRPEPAHVDGEVGEPVGTTSDEPASAIHLANPGGSSAPDAEDGSTIAPPTGTEDPYENYHRYAKEAEGVPVGTIDIDNYESKSIQEVSREFDEENRRIQTELGAVEIGVTRLEDDPNTEPRGPGTEAPKPADSFAQRLADFAMADGERSRAINAEREDAETARRQESAEALAQTLGQFQSAAADLNRQKQMQAFLGGQSRQNRHRPVSTRPTSAGEMCTDQIDPATGCHVGHDENAHPGGCNPCAN